MKYLISFFTLFFIASLSPMENPSPSLEDSQTNSSISIITSNRVTFEMPKEVAIRSFKPVRAELEYNPTQNEFEFKYIDSSLFIFCYLHATNKKTMHMALKKGLSELDEEDHKKLKNICLFLEYWPLLALLNYPIMQKELYEGKRDRLTLYSDNPNFRYKLYKQFKNIPKSAAECLGAYELYELKEHPRPENVTRLIYIHSAPLPFSLHEKLPLCVSLKYLSLYRMKLGELPKELFQLTSLEELYISGNDLEVLSSEIGQLTNLRDLTAISNRLTEIPPQLGELTNLKSLSLMHNNIIELPEDITRITRLSELYLSNNKLSSIPPLTGLKKLITLWISSNPLKGDTKEMLRIGFSHIKSLKI